MARVMGGRALRTRILFLVGQAGGVTFEVVRSVEEAALPLPHARRIE